MLTLALALSAHASPGSAGAVHLGASALDGGQAWAGTGLLTTWGGGLWAGPALEAGAALGPEGHGAFTVATATDMRADGLPVALSLRHNVVDGERFRLAATGQALVLAGLPGAWMLEGGIQQGDVATWISPGLALEAGSEDVYFDLALPVWGLSSHNQYVGMARTPFPLAGTLGVSVEVADHHRLRLGLPELVSWSVRTKDAYFDLGGITIGAAGVVWTKVGLIF